MTPIPSRQIRAVARFGCRGNQSKRTCTLSLETPCYGLTIEERDFDGNHRLHDDMQTLIDAVASAI